MLIFNSSSLIIKYKFLFRIRKSKIPGWPYINSYYYYYYSIIGVESLNRLKAPLICVDVLAERFIYIDDADTVLYCPTDKNHAPKPVQVLRLI